MYDAETGEELTDHELSTRYDDWLDEVHGDVEVAGMSYSTSRVLAEIDPIAYRCGQSDWESYMVEDGVLTEEAPEDDEEDDEEEDEDDE